jgi:hypothetical protein
MPGGYRLVGRTFKPAPVHVGARLWHLAPYLGESKPFKLDTFLRGGLWFTRLDKFRAEEGRVPRRNLGLLEAMPDDMKDWVKRQYRLAVLRSYATCWFRGKEPSAEMWKKFARGGKGVAIRTSTEAVEVAISPFTDPHGGGPIYFGRASYIDHGKDSIDEGNTLAAAFAKQKVYVHENEARVLIHSYGENAVKYLLGRAGPCGPLVSHVAPGRGESNEDEFTGGQANGEAILLGIAPMRFLQEIVLGPGLDARKRAEIVDRINDHGLGSKIRC